MTVLNAILNRTFDLLLGPFQAEGPWPAMVLVSLVTTMLILLIFKLTSNAKTTQRRKNRALARLLEFVLFKDDVVVSLGAFGRSMVANMAYLGTLTLPLLASLIPMVLIVIQVSCWFSARPLRQGETTILTARLQDSVPVMGQTLTLTPSSSIVVDSEPVRTPSQNEVSWRLRVTSAYAKDAKWVDLNVNGAAIRKSIVAGLPTVSRLSPARPPAGFWAELTNPGEAPLPPDGPVTELTVRYPPAGLTLGGRSYHWLLVFCVLTLVFGGLLLKPLRVVI